MSAAAVSTTDAARYKRRAKPGELVLHPTESVIIVKLIESYADHHRLLLAALIHPSGFTKLFCVFGLARLL